MFFVVQIAAVVYWSSPLGHRMAVFDLNLLILGTFVGVFRTLSMIWTIIALSIGPQPIVMALVCSSTLMLTIIEAVRNMKAPNLIEFICLFVGFIGTLELMIPQHVEAFFLCIFCCGRSTVDVDSEPSRNRAAAFEQSFDHESPKSSFSFEYIDGDVGYLEKSTKENSDLEEARNMSEIREHMLKRKRRKL